MPEHNKCEIEVEVPTVKVKFAPLKFRLPGGEEVIIKPNQSVIVKVGHHRLKVVYKVIPLHAEGSWRGIYAKFDVTLGLKDIDANVYRYFESHIFTIEPKKVKEDGSTDCCKWIIERAGEIITNVIKWTGARPE